MPSLPAIAQSGMNAAQSTLQVSAHNIANWATDGFRRQRAVLTSVPNGGVDTRIEQSPVVGNFPEADVVEMLQAKNSFLANLAVFRTGDRMMGSLLDVTS